MTEQVQAHETSTAVIKAPLTEVEAGANIVLKVRLVCQVCDLRGRIIRIIDGENAPIMEDIGLTGFDRTANETDEFVVKAPAKPGSYVWTAVFPVQEKENVSYAESSAPISFIVKPHAIRLEVLDAPDPVASGDNFKIKVGAKCPFGCELTDLKIEVHDHEGAPLATVTLGGVSSPATTAQLGAEVELHAPSIEGRYQWTVKLRKPDLDLAHADASCFFAFGVAGQPEHVVTVEVIDQEAQTRIKNALVSLQPHIYTGYAYRIYADEDGVARVSVPKGDYRLYVSGDNMETFEPTVTVVSDITIKAELFFKEVEPPI